MKSRFNMGRVQPGAYKAMDSLDTYIAGTSVNQLHQELMRIRASQINGCAYCVNSHTGDARKHGETEQRLHLISVWKEAGNIFTEEERLLLEMTEEITLIHQHGLSGHLYERSVELFGQEKTAQVIMTIITINAWNRIGVALKMKPEL
jgi:AhpD family alkylhydroperoxidase